MRHLKTILIPIGLVAIVGSVLAFTNPKNGDGDKKCQIKIIKNINGVETVVDSTFDCPEDMTWIQTFHDEMDGDSIHKIIKVMMLDGDSSEFNFDFNFNFDESVENGMKIMKFKGDDGEEIEITMDQIHEQLGNLSDKMWTTVNQMGDDLEVIIENTEEGTDAHRVKVIKTIDEKGNVVVKKIVNGEEVEVNESDMDKMNGKHQMIFISDDGKVNHVKGNQSMTIDVTVDSENGKETKHIVMITKIAKDSDDELAKKIAETENSSAKNELSINNLKFSPNPNDGKFDLSFKLDKKDPITISIFDMQGKKVYHEKITSFSGKYNNNIDITGKGEGIYILQIVQNESVSTSKIVIK
ncbi:MAG: T9SS type A sorting domain-containing protein [Flavobacteriales bacterium]